MRGKHINAFVLVLGCSANSGLCETPMGTGFTYQGHLLDNGTPADGQYDFQFMLCDSDEGANPCEVAETTVVHYADEHPVKGGLFTVEVDFGRNVFDGTGRWLEIGVRPGPDTGVDPYEVLEPRQKLTPTPYALALPGVWTQENGPDEPPNVIGGYNANNVTSGVVGATIGGGGGALDLGLEYRVPNQVTGDYGTVAGGRANQAAEDGTVGGGRRNTASGSNSTVGGGYLNTASGTEATVAGGSSNTAAMLYSTVGGGWENTASGDGSTVGGGEMNYASGSDSVIGGGLLNGAFGYSATVAGGVKNYAIGSEGTVGGGNGNLADGDKATVGGGIGNGATGVAATVGGGEGNRASGPDSTVPGGSRNEAAGAYSFAAGRRAMANHDGAFVWGDSADADLVSTGVDQFVARASGGVWFYSDASLGSGVNLPVGSGAWSDLSDRNAKGDYACVDGREILERVAGVPVTTWSYKTQDGAIRHIGPTAQDFHDAFGVGEDDKHISTVDAAGVALAAIQGLYQIVKEKDEHIAILEARLADLEALMVRVTPQQARR